MNYITANKLKAGDTVCVIAPSHSDSILTDEVKKIAFDNFSAIGLKIIFGKNIHQTNEVGTSSIENRLEDLRSAFEDPKINGILTIRGGYHGNDLLPHINWEVIRNNPKVFCGFSDTTILNNAIFAKTNLITYSGPNFIDFGQKQQNEYMLEYFKKCLMSNEPYKINPSQNWNEDEWWLNQDLRKPILNEGFKVFNNNKQIIEGTLLGGNLSTLNLLQGTGFLPNINDTVLIVEDDDLVDINLFIRMLQSLLQQKEFQGIKALCIGRFKTPSNIETNILLDTINEVGFQIKIPIITNLDFGHTNPQFTIPIGGQIQIDLQKDVPTIEILVH